MPVVGLWKRLYDHYKGDPSALTMCTIAMLIGSEAPLYFFTLLDMLGLKALYKYRLHYAESVSGHLSSRHYPPLELMKDVAKVCEFNFLFAYVIPGAIAIHLANKLKIYVYDTDRDISWSRLIKETFLISVVADIMFYWQHRLMHTPDLYFLHKKHHEFKYSLALVHHYMTYREALLFAIPQALPPLILWGLTGSRMHILSMWCGFSFTQLAAILGHAGWKVPLPDWLPFLKPAYHDLHHVDYSVNFGAIYEWTDFVFGTLLRAPLADAAQIAKYAAGKSYDYAANAPTLKDFPRFP